jgi:hypothetical protein
MRTPPRGAKSGNNSGDADPRRREDKEARTSCTSGAGDNDCNADRKVGDMILAVLTLNSPQHHSQREAYLG